MPYSVLVVDDSTFMRNSLKNIITSNGYYIIAGEARNGIEAIKKYRELKPDVMIMDIVMPDMSGIDAIKKIKEYDKDARIITCSSMGQKSFIVDAIEAGAKDFVVKPFQPGRVLKALANALLKLEHLPK